MNSRGMFITLTGLLAIGGTTAALAQPVPVPTPEARPTAPVIVVPAPSPVAPVPTPWPEPDAIAPVPDPIAPVIVQGVPMPDMIAPLAEPVIVSHGVQGLVIPDGIDPLIVMPSGDEMRRALAEAESALQRIEIQMPPPEKIDEAMRKSHEAIEKARAGLEKSWDAPQKVDSMDGMEKALDAIEKARAGMEKFEFEWADAKKGRAFDEVYAIKSPKKGIYAMRLDQEAVVKIARRFEGCDNWRGRDENEHVENHYYDCGRRAVDESQWDRAADYFGRAAAAKGQRADGALYWKAYAQDRLGQRAEALATIAELKTAYGKGRWVNDANALEMQVRQRSGEKVNPQEAPDDDIKLLAVNALGDSPEALPILEKLLQGPQSPKLKDRALFVLAQNQNPAARAVLIKIAKGGGNPELQLRAVQYLGRIGSAESREILSQVYASSPDAQVKRTIIRSYMESQDRTRLVSLARAEQDQALRIEAVRQLGNMRAGSELMELYARESSPEVKKQILRGLGNSGHTTQLVELAQREQDPELKRLAIRTLGVNRSAETGTQLLNIYAKDTNEEVREAAIEALFVQGNATGLVSLARQEKNPELRRRIVSKLSVMKNPEAREFLLELLK